MTHVGMALDAFFCRIPPQISAMRDQSAKRKSRRSQDIVAMATRTVKREVKHSLFGIAGPIKPGPINIEILYYIPGAGDGLDR